MLASIILDAYTHDEMAEMAYGLMRLCAAPSQKIFSRVGVYAYWDFDTREVLYIGRTADLTRRFLEHNGLIRCAPNCCKVAEIRDYFQSHEKLGFSLFLQSKMHDDGIVQPNPNALIEEIVGVSNAEMNAIFAEGVLLRQYREKNGDRPKWNRNDGSSDAIDAPLTMRGSKLMQEFMTLVEGQGPLRPTVDVLEGMVGRDNSMLVSRYTLRKIVSDYTVEVREDMLHGRLMSN